MTAKTMPWSLKGVSLEARERAKEAAAREGLPIGIWLGGVIRTIAAAERADAEAHPVGGPRLSSIERAMSRLDPAGQ